MRLLMLACLLPTTLHAAATGSFAADYTGYAHGLTVLKLSASLDLTPAGYSAHISFHTAGLIGMVVHSDNVSEAQGTFVGDGVAPRLFAGHGRLRGQDRATQLEYENGSPVIRLLQPPVDANRTAVAPQDMLHTIDTLSAAALLVRRVAQGGRCDGTATTFDGRRLSVLTAQTTGQETLPETSRSIFAGQALRCDFDGRQTGGFVNDENEDALRRPKHGVAWLAPLLPNAPPVPVRVVFENKILGQVTLYLTGLQAK